MNDSDSDVSIGTPKLKNIREYWLDIENNPRKYLHYSPDLNESDLAVLDESFHDYIEQRKRELQETKEKEQTIEDDGQTVEDNRQTRESNRKYEEETQEQEYLDESTMMEDSWLRKTSDLSFELAEKASMLDITKSNDESISVDQMLADIKFAKIRGASIGLNDMTQLEDVEAPSMMFEATINPEAAYEALSPVKRVHLHRQSTILEESTIVESESSKNSSKNDSYVTAKQNFENYSSDTSTTVFGSETYKTAAENTSASSTDYPDLFHRSKIPNRKFLDESDGAISINDSNHSQPIKKINTDVIEISSSSDEIEELDDSMPQSKFRNIHDTLISAKCKKETELHKEFTIDSSDDSFIIEPTYNDEEEETAVPEINDSLDRFDFLMNPDNINIIKVAQTDSKALPPKVSSFTPNGQNYMKKKNHNSPLCKQVLFPKNTNSASKAEHPTFKKPVGISKLPQPKSAKKTFDHIKSPIGTYIKSTPQSILSAHKRETPKNLAQDLYNKNDRDSVYSVKENFDDNLDSYKPSIPMKIGLASKHRQWADERKQVKIPGGQKVGKILHDYSQATVVKHQGRMKTGLNRLPSIDPNDTIANSTFGNLSIQSGDVSLQVFKDARPSNF